jgi:hypothetical protein
MVPGEFKLVGVKLCGGVSRFVKCKGALTTTSRLSTGKSATIVNSNSPFYGLSSYLAVVQTAVHASALSVSVIEFEGAVEE